MRVFIKDSPTTNWRLAGKTEVIDNNLNPDWRTTVKFFFQFEVNQTIRLEVVDSDGGDDVDLIGQVETSVASLVGSKNQTFEAELFVPGKSEKRGRIIAKVVPLKKSEDEIILTLGASQLPMQTSCFCGGSINPYLVIDKSYNAGGKLNYVSIHRSEVSTSQRPDPQFQPIKLRSQTLCNSNLD